MPDISRDQRPEITGVLHKVGMTGIHVRVLLGEENGCQMAAPAVAKAFVSLDNPEDKGIHMSRLFLSLQETLDQEVLSPETVQRILERFLESHAGQSHCAFVDLALDYMTRRPALVSENTGWRSYPVTLGGGLHVRSASENGDSRPNAGPRQGAGAQKSGRTCDRWISTSIEYEASVQIEYSSTCPCSGALSRDVAEQDFRARFQGDSVSVEDVAIWLREPSGMPATPHSQRSLGTIKIRFSDPAIFPGFGELIDRLESAIQTSVQAAVKREDEQEFARLNAQNLMFCEDAARRLRAALDALPGLDDYWVEARHFESLHPHDAVAVVTKGIRGGYRA